MPSTSALSEFKLKLIQCRVFKIVVRDGGGDQKFCLGGFFYRVNGTKGTKLEQNWNRSNDYS